MTAQIRIVRLLLPLLILAFLGCESKDKESLREIARDAQRAVDQVAGKLGELAPDTNKIKNMTSDELEKLFAFEYLVTDIPSGAGTIELQEKFSALGRDRWECFALDRQGDKLRVFCKRRPETYLRYIPRMF